MAGKPNALPKGAPMPRGFSVPQDRGNFVPQNHGRILQPEPFVEGFDDQEEDISLYNHGGEGSDE